MPRNRHSWITRVCFLGMLLGAAGACKKATILSPTARILATVNDEAITVGEFQKGLEQDSQIPPGPQDPDELKTLKRDLLQQLIDRRLFLQEAKRLKLSVGDDELSQASSQIR